MDKKATLSPCGTYRYDLQRIWDPEKPLCVFIGLNPSTADAEFDDQTTKKCIRFANGWGYGRLTLVNAYAYRATKPVAMPTHEDHVGPENDAYLKKWAEEADVLIAGWGTRVTLGRRKQLLDNVLAPYRDHLHYLRLTSEGHPAHPLYLPANSIPLKWETAAA